MDKPFYLIHSLSKVHNNNYVSERYKGKSPAEIPYVLEGSIMGGPYIVQMLHKKGIENDFLSLPAIAPNPE